MNLEQIRDARIPTTRIRLPESYWDRVYYSHMRLNNSPPIPLDSTTIWLEHPVIESESDIEFFTTHVFPHPHVKTLVLADCILDQRWSDGFFAALAKMKIRALELSFMGMHRGALEAIPAGFVQPYVEEYRVPQGVDDSMFPNGKRCLLHRNVPLHTLVPRQEPALPRQGPDLPRRGPDLVVYPARFKEMDPTLTGRRIILLDDYDTLYDRDTIRRLLRAGNWVEQSTNVTRPSPGYRVVEKWLESCKICVMLVNAKTWLNPDLIRLMCGCVFGAPWSDSASANDSDGATEGSD